MRENQAQPILARTTQNFGHARGDEVLELVHIAPKVPATANLLGLPAHGGLLEFRYQERAKEKRILRPDLTLRKFREKDFARVHEVCEIESIERLRHHVTNRSAG